MDGMLRRTVEVWEVLVLLADALGVAFICFGVFQRWALLEMSDGIGLPSVLPGDGPRVVLASAPMAVLWSIQGIYNRRKGRWSNWSFFGITVYGAGVLATTLWALLNPSANWHLHYSLINSSRGIPRLHVSFEPGIYITTAGACLVLTAGVLGLVASNRFRTPQEPPIDSGAMAQPGVA